MYRDNEQSNQDNVDGVTMPEARPIRLSMPTSQ
jgi:hypothetical protein